MELQVEQIIADTLEIPVESVTDELTSDDLEEWDSLASMTIVRELEKHFNIHFSFDDLLNLDSVKGIKKMISEKNV